MFQADLLHVLNAFEVNAPDDFYRLPPGRRPYFLRRLYKAFVDNYDDAQRDLSSAGGVKFHFKTSGDLRFDGHNVPSQTFLKKICFYSTRTLITFPFKRISSTAETRVMKGIHAKTWRKDIMRQNSPLIFGDLTTERTPVGGMVELGSKGGYSLDPAAFEDFLNILTSLKPAVNSGLTYLLPAFPDQKRDFRRLSTRLTSANFRLSDLSRQFKEEELSSNDYYRFKGDLLNIYMPHFTNVPIERIVEIREKHVDSYNDFQRYMENLLYGISEEETEVRILSIMRDIDMGVRELRKKFLSVSEEYRRRDIYIGIGMFCTSLAIYASVEYGKDIAQLIGSITGGATGIGLLKNSGEKKKSALSISQDNFYLPWLLQREAEKISDNLSKS